MPSQPPPDPRDTVDIARDGLSAALADRRRLVLSIVIGLLLAIGVVLLIGKASGFARLVDRLREAHYGWIALGVAVQVASIVGYVVAFRAITERSGRGHLPPRPTAQIVLAGLGATRLLAAAGAGGLAVNYWGLRRAGIAAREAVTRVLMLNTLLYLVFGLIGVVAASVLLVRGDAPLGLTLPWIVVICGCVLAAGYVASPRRAERLARDPVPDPASSRLVTTLRRGFATTVEGLRRLRAAVLSPRDELPLVMGAVTYWVSDIACLAIGLAAFGVEVSLWVVALGYTTGYVANLLPLPTGGVGGVDAAMTFALNLLGVPLEDALAGVIAYRFVGFWLPTIPGVWALVRLPHLGRNLEARSV